MKLEERYIILKVTDVERHLHESDRLELKHIGQKIDRARDIEGRGDFSAIVIEKDWPEYEAVLQLLSKRVDGIED